MHKDHKPTDAVLPPAEQESELRDRLNTHLTEVGMKQRPAQNIWA